jgi:hypothetical protein
VPHFASSALKLIPLPVQENTRPSLIFFAGSRIYQYLLLLTVVLSCPGLGFHCFLFGSYRYTEGHHYAGRGDSSKGKECARPATSTADTTETGTTSPSTRAIVALPHKFQRLERSTRQRLTLSDIVYAASLFEMLSGLALHPLREEIQGFKRFERGRDILVISIAGLHQPSTG